MVSPWVAAAAGTGIYIVCTLITCSMVFICRMKDKPLGITACVVAGICTWILWFMTYISQINPYGPPEVKPID
ncbi:hypothetical protein KM1_148040 [Entamoeba histolytica HM-3:IMSS]|uniref:Coiled-coil protein n=2 Tax=Entamoeba histolytica TaxID=5759 RepID=A0A175JJE1_ENTHI|nr:hypothetical protein KM1_148040 [Entamoeba histolytica HM-3:IMSS]GAT93675.1 coiled-coil protein [Entamoeba histolytica]GAT94877.1 hypothetical protein CL6EHI_c00099 [Entamoeba histolytica]